MSTGIRLASLGILLSAALGCVPRRPDPAPERPRLRAICVGVNQFIFTNPNYRDLKYAVNDAEAFSRLFASERFCGDRGFSERKVRLYVDRGANKSDLDVAFRDGLADLRPGDWVAVFISTHGVSDPDRNDLTSLLCHDSVSDKPYRALRGTSLEAAYLVDQLAAYARSAARILLIVDACKAGPAVHGSLHRLIQNSSAAGRLPPATILTASSTDFAFGGNEELLDGKGHGSFTLQLLKGLGDGSSDLDGNGTVSAREAYDHADRGLRGTQKPAIEAGGNPVLFDARRPSDVVGEILRIEEPSTREIRPSDDPDARGEPKALARLLGEPRIQDFPYYRHRLDFPEWDELDGAAQLLRKALQANSSWRIAREVRAKYFVVAANLAYLDRGDVSPKNENLREAHAYYQIAEDLLQDAQDPESRVLLARAKGRRALCHYMDWSAYTRPETYPHRIRESMLLLEEVRSIARTLPEGDDRTNALALAVAGLLACCSELAAIHDAAKEPDRVAEYRERMKREYAEIPAKSWLAANLELNKRASEVWTTRANLAPDGELAALRKDVAGFRHPWTLESPDYAFNLGTAYLVLGARFLDLEQWTSASEVLAESDRLLERVRYHPALWFLKARWHPLIQRAECAALRHVAALRLDDRERAERFLGMAAVEVKLALKIEADRVSSYVRNPGNEFRRLGEEKIRKLLE